MIDLKAHKPAKRYAQAIFDIIKEKDEASVFNNLSLVLAEIESNSELRNFLFHPMVALDDKKSAVKEIFSNFDDDTLNFIYLILDENRLDCLDEIIDYLHTKINEKNNIALAEITLAIEPTGSTKGMIISRLENKLQTKLEAKFCTDESIIGGMKIRIKDTLYDLSVKGKIDNIKRI